MNGKVICLVGDMGCGKTTYIKDMTSTSKKDILWYLRIMADVHKGKVHTNFLSFIKEANAKSNSIICIDEAFTVLPKNLRIRPDKPMSIDNQIADLLVNSRKLNNFVFIVFHSLSQVPSEWLIPYLDYFVRFRTNDQIQYQINRFSSFPEIILSLQKNDIRENFVCDEIQIRK